MLLSSRRRRLFWRRIEEALPLGSDVPVAGWIRTVAAASYPSTFGLTILTAVALPIDAQLAAFLAGILLGLALGALWLGVEIIIWERHRGLRLFYGSNAIHAR